MWNTGLKSNRISPTPGEAVVVTEFDSGDWADTKPKQFKAFDRQKHKGARRTFEAGHKDYESYVEKRVFNKRESWTPFLWQRKRDKHLAVQLNPTTGWKGLKYRQQLRWNSLKIRWTEWSRSLEVWRASLKSIEGHQGTGVVSYFVFLKWILFLNVFIFLLMFWAIVFIQAAFPQLPYGRQVTGSDDSATVAGVVLADNCSAQYIPDVTDGFQVVLDFVQGTGWMEKTAFFYGYYTNTELHLPTSDYNMPLAYFLVTLLVLIVSLIVMVRHTVVNYMDTILQQEEHSHHSKFFYMIFGGWDFTVCENFSTAFQHTRFYHCISSELEELKHDIKTKESSNCRLFCLWSVRVVINLFIVALLLAAAVAIYFAQDFSSNFTNGPESKNYHGLVVTMVEYLPSTIIGILNGVCPLLFQLLVKFEDYKPSFVIKLTLIRTVFLRFAALAVIVGTIYQKITCSPSNECLVGAGIASCPAIQCWETYVGQQIYKLCVSEFFFDVFLILGYELPRKLIATKCSCTLATKLKPAEFDIAISVLDVVYAQALCWLGFFFAPLLPVMSVLRLIILFYLKKLSALFNTVPPERPYQAARSNAFFMVILLIAFFLVAVPIGYVLVQLKPSPMCGPFRIYSNPTNIIEIQVGIATGWVQTVWKILSSSALIITAVVIMGLALYYCSAVRSSNRKIVTLLKKQILEDEKDKQFLLARLAQYTDDFSPAEKKPLINSKADLPAKRHDNLPDTNRSYNAASRSGSNIIPVQSSNANTNPTIPTVTEQADW